VLDDVRTNRMAPIGLRTLDRSLSGHNAVAISFVLSYIAELDPTSIQSSSTSTSASTSTLTFSSQAAISFSSTSCTIPDRSLSI